MLKKLTSLCLILAAGVMTTRADSLNWDQLGGGTLGGTGTWNLNSTANWWNGGGDVNWADNSAAGTNSAIFAGTAGTVTLNTSLSASNLQFTTTGYTVSGSGTLTLGAGGIDASALGSGTTTIGNALSLSSGQQLWQVGSGGTLAINGAVSRSAGAAVDFSTTGTYTSSSLTNVNGVIGGWATVGASANQNTTGDWAATNGSGGVVAYTGYTVGTTITTGATANWKNTATATVSGAVTINSLNQQADVNINSGATLTLGNGGLLMFAGPRWILNNNNGNTSGTGALTSGSATGELFLHVPYSGGANNWTVWPKVTDNGATAVKVVKNGAGSLFLPNANTFSGGLTVNGGIVSILSFGGGNMAVNGGQLRLGYLASGTAAPTYTGSVALNGGAFYEQDSFIHLSGTVTVGPAGGSLGATYDGSGDALVNSFAKGLFIDGLVTGSGPLTVQDSGIETVNAWDSSTVYFTSTGTAAQNTYSGTVTVNPFSAHGGSYLFLVGTNVLANATINLTGDNSASLGRLGVPSLIFGSGTNLNGVGYATIGGLSGSGSVLLANTLVTNGTTTASHSVGAPFALTVGNNNSSPTYSGILSGAGSLTKIGNGTLTLSGANTYTGNTTVNGGTLAVSSPITSTNNVTVNGGTLSLSGSASIIATNISVGQGATLDVSALGSVTLGGSQVLYGGGTNVGSVYTSSGTKIYAGTDGGYGTNVFNNDLTLASGALTYMDVGTLANGSNDLITVAGTLYANNNTIHLKAPSTSSSLQTVNHTLITTVGGISGSFAGLVWDVAPVNAGNFTLAISGNNVILQYSSSTVPTAAGTATPSPAFRNQNVLITVTATNGVGGTVNGVTVDASTIGVVSPVTLVNAGGNVWTNTVAVTPDTLAGGKTLVATVTATSSLNGITSIPLTVVVGNDVWNGAGTGNNFSTALNWTNKLAPGYVGDSLEFAAGVTDLTPNVDLAYIVTGITFDSGAGSYNLGGSTLTLSGSGSLVNNSANPQTLNVPLADSGGGLTKTGNGLISLAAANLYGGPTVVNAGTLSVPGSVSGGDVTVAGLAGNAALTVSGSLGGGTNTLAVGTVTNAVGAVWQTGGTISLGTGTAFFGHLPGGYGYGRIDGGTFSMSELQIGTWGSSGGNGGNALFEVNGGTVTDSGWLPMARGGAAQTGVLNMFSGSLSFAGGGLICNFGSGQTSIINILGGSVNSSSAGVGLGSGTSILNLNGGLLSVNQVGSWAPWSYQGNNGRVSFNGGTLQASAGSSAFLTVNSANIYSGGATIDNNGNAITIGQALLAPAGNGINSASVTSGGAGYIAPPIITITNATGDTTGIGATAIAQINPLTGVVTNVIVTCPGVNYTATPIFVVSGGGATTPAVITGATPTANPSGGLTSIGSGTLTLTNANTYTGNTTISNGTLALATGGSISSTNIIVISGTTFDPSASTFSMGNGQKLSGEGTVNGLVAGSGSKIFPGTDGTAGTLSFSGNLTLGSGATANFDLDTTYNGANDQINGSGTLTLNGNAIHIKAPSTSASLDHSGNDYVLITAGSISGSFASTPVWDVKPVNSANYTVVTSGSQVTLHYSSFTAPTGSGFATPSPAIHNQNVLITVTVTNGSGTVDPNTGVVLNAGTLDGSLSSVPLVLASTISSTVHVYTNTITVPMSAAAGSYTLSAVITDSNGLIGTANISLAVSTTEVWNGGGSSTNLNWSNDPNWVVGMAPELSGDSLIFAGTVGTAPNMDNNYSVTGLTFSNNATSFTIGSTTSSTLTLTANGIVNNSANAQTLNVPITMSAPQTFNAASGNITVSGAIDDAGNGYALTKTGTGALVLSGTNTYTGQTAVKAGTMSVTGGQVLSPTAAGPGLTIGDAGKAILNVSVGTVEGNTSDGEFGTGIVVGPTSGGAGAVVVSGTGSVTSGRQIVLGNAANSYGAWTQSGGTGGTGTNTGGFLVVGASSASGVFSQSGGTFTVGWNAGTIGAGNSSSFGVMNLSGGTFSSMATSGSYSTAGGLAVGEFGTAVLNVSGTASVNLSGNFNLTLGKNSGANGTVNLLGGTLATTKVSSGSGTGTFNFNGGTLQASTANASFMSGLTGAYVYSGGAVINDGGNAVTIAQPLLVPSGYGVVSIPVSNGGSGYIAAPVVTITNISASGSGATAVANVSGGTITSITVTSHGQGYGSGDTLGVALVGGGGSGAIIGTPVLAANTSGGLTKLGAGTLTLAGANTYTGNTTISAGTLELAQATLATNSTVSISNSAVLNLDFTTTNQISALVLGGVSQLPGVYNSTTTPTYISGTGSLVVPSATATNPTNITFSVTGGGSTLSLSWPADHLGWTLQQQTNSLSTGLSTNWVNVAGSESITSTNITIDPAKPTVFYRLVLP